MSNCYDVIIIGAGPTGLALANLLGKASVRTLLVEQHAATVGEPRAVSIDDESLRVVAQIGLIDTVRAELVSGYGSEYLGPDRRLFLKVKPTEQPYGHPRRNAFRQPIFEAQLREGLSRFPHVETRFECAALSFHRTGRGITVHLAGGNGEETVEARHLIGCDGARSSTREALGSRFAGSSLNERWLIIDLENSPGSSPETIVYADPDRSGIMLPGPRETRRYEFKLKPGETDEAMLVDANVAHLLALHDCPTGSHIVRKTVYHFHARIADSWGRDGVWLAGDAAHLMPPFAGQGMNAGIRDAANLSWKLAAVIAGKFGPRLLDTYEHERRAHVGQMIQLALRMGTVFGPANALYGLAIRTAFRVLGLWPKARRYFAEMKYKPAPRFDRGFLLEKQLSRAGLVGRMILQPPLPGKQTLDDLLGDGFALIGIDVVVENIDLGERWTSLIERRLTLSSTNIPQFRAHSGKVLLVRPDRYVVACFQPSEASAMRTALEVLVRATWSDPDHA